MTTPGDVSIGSVIVQGEGITRAPEIKSEATGQSTDW